MGLYGTELKTHNVIVITYYFIFNKILKYN